MPIRFLAAILFLLAAASGNPGRAQIYVGVSGGLGAPIESDVDLLFGGSQSETFASGPEVAAQIGYRLNMVRIEFEAGWGQFDFEGGVSNGTPFTVTGNTDILTFLVNAYLDFPLRESGFVPYVGVGAGAAVVSRNDRVVTISGTPTARSDDSTTVAALQLGAGLGYRLSDKTIISVGYRFIDTGVAQFSDLRGYRLSRHSFLGGVRFFF